MTLKALATQKSHAFRYNGGHVFLFCHQSSFSGDKQGISNDRHASLAAGLIKLWVYFFVGIAGGEDEQEKEIEYSESLFFFKDLEPALFIHVH